jgi:hypothetical protein
MMHNKNSKLKSSAVVALLAGGMLTVFVSRLCIPLGPSQQIAMAVGMCATLIGAYLLKRNRIFFAPDSIADSSIADSGKMDGIQVGNWTQKRKALYLRYLKVYTLCLCVPIFVLIFAYAQGASWEPTVVGIPAYLSIFIIATVQLVKDARALGREERGEPDPPRKRGPWEEE